MIQGSQNTLRRANHSIISLAYCMHLYTCKNTAVHSFPQREEKQPGPFSRLDGKVSRSPFLAGSSMSQWHFCFLSRPGPGFYFLHLEKHLPALGTLCCKYFPSLKHLSYLKRRLASPHILVLIRGPQVWFMEAVTEPHCTMMKPFSSRTALQQPSTGLFLSAIACSIGQVPLQSLGNSDV